MRTFLVFLMMVYSHSVLSVDVSCLKKENGRCITFDEIFFTQQKKTFLGLPRILEFWSTAAKAVQPTTTVSQPKHSQGYINFSSTRSSDYGYGHKKSFKPRKECDPDLDWDGFVKCTNERMNAKN
jgi:hypothetical protein